MRANPVAILVILMAAPTAFAQGDDLTSVLRGWEKALADAKTSSVEIRRDINDPILKTRDIHDGGIVFAKSGERARFRYELNKAGTLSEKFVSDGKDLYEFVPATKVVRVRVMPNMKEGTIGLVSLVFEINAQRTQARYNMTLEKANDETDKHYHYIRVRPKEARDKSGFQEMQIILQRSDFMPRRIAYQQVNNVTTTWDFNKLNLNVQIPDKLFALDTDGWRVERVPAK